MPVPFRLPKFYPILDTATLLARGVPVGTAADALLDAGVKILQYRQALAERCQERGVLFVLNDRADYAKLLKTALHVGQDDLPPAAARRVIGDEVMGLSTHSRNQLEEGNSATVEYLSIGPIFQTISKLRPDPVIGLSELAALREVTAKPLCAIGGITLGNARDVITAKADSVAVISGILPENLSGKAICKRAEEWLTLLA
jgi:thiamine-phosphate pyrophosphorylase